jgi:hypothetical protein
MLMESAVRVAAPGVNRNPVASCEDHGADTRASQNGWQDMPGAANARR